MSTKTLSYNQFTYSNKLFQANTSSLNLEASSTYPENINLIGTTGAAVLFEFEKAVTGVDGVVSWNYTPTADALVKVPDAKGLRIRIFNI